MQPAVRLALAVAVEVAQLRAHAALARARALRRCDRSTWQRRDLVASLVAHREAAALTERATLLRSTLDEARRAAPGQTVVEWLGCDPATYARAVAEVLAEEQSLC